MQYIVSEIHTLLLKRRKTLAVAESCTGGLVSKLLTDIPASSKYFTLGIVTYSNKAKEIILKIPHSIIVKYGAVSYKVAQRMSQSVRKLMKTDIGIGISGIAGPIGGTLHKPVGTVFIAIDSKNNKICKKFHFSGNRAAVRTKTAIKSLQLLKQFVSAKL
jgi:PncC family amidohydrolase